MTDTFRIDQGSFASWINELADDSADFVHKQIRARNLSKIVAQLNDQVLNGTLEEKADAELALSKLGFA